MAQRVRRKVAYRKRTQNRFSMVLVIMVVLLITMAVALRSAELNKRIEVLSEQEAELQGQITEEEIRAREIEQYRIETQTKRFVEEVAKEKLGLVYEGEIVFQEEK